MSGTLLDTLVPDCVTPDVLDSVSIGCVPARVSCGTGLRSEKMRCASKK